MSSGRMSQSVLLRPFEKIRMRNMTNTNHFRPFAPSFNRLISPSTVRMVEWDKYGRMYTNTLTISRFDQLKHHLRPKILWFDRLTHTFAHFSLGSTLHFQKRLFFENQLILIKFFKSWKNLMILIRFWFGFDLEQVYQRELCILSMKTSSNQSIYHQISLSMKTESFWSK